jgi:hypothetical protein
MSKITRYTGNLKAPASNASVNKRGTFGDPTGAADDTLDANLNAQLIQGWEFVGPSEYPTLQDFNSMGFTLGQIHAYLHQVGVPEWSPLQEYYVGAIANVGGALYRCLADNIGTNPVGDPTGTWVGVGLGVGQTFKTVTGSRAIGVTYTNTTGAPIQLNVRVASTALQIWTLTVGGGVTQSYSNNGIDGTFWAVVPDGFEYALTGGTILNYWAELRA